MGETVELRGQQFERQESVSECFVQGSEESLLLFRRGSGEAQCCGLALGPHSSDQGRTHDWLLASQSSLLAKLGASHREG